MINQIGQITAVQKNTSKKSPPNLNKAVKLDNKALRCSADNCLDAMGRAQVSINKTTKSSPESEEDVMNLVKEILASKGMILSEDSSEHFIRGGVEIPGFRGLCNRDITGKCIRDKNGFLEKIILLDMNTRGVSFYNSEGVLYKEFSPDEVKALKEYKYSPNQFHSYFRKDRRAYVPDQSKFMEHISLIDNLFLNSDKISKTQEPTVVYRALQNSLNPEQEKALQTIGGIFEEPSYASTSKSLDVAQGFQRYNPILEITLPQGAKYIDIDEIFNIDREHWREQEFLLPRNAKFKITGFSEDGKIIKAEYILPDSIQ